MTQNILDRISLSLHRSCIIFAVSALVISIGAGASSVVAQDGVAGATSYVAAPTLAAGPYDTDYEAVSYTHLTLPTILLV